MASIEKRKTTDGTTKYRVRITLAGHPRISETFTTRRAAKRWAERTTEAMRQRRFKPGSEAEQRALSELVERFVTEKLTDLTASDRPHLTGKLLRWCEQLGSGTKLAQITPAAITLARDRLAQGDSLSGRVPSPSTVKRYLAILSRAFSVAVKEWWWMDDNPCTKVVRPKEPRGRVRFLDEEERDRLLAACKESRETRLYPLVVLALSTGARRGELLALRWRDLDLDRGTAIFEHTKNGDRRAAPLVGPALEVLRDWQSGRQHIWTSTNGTRTSDQVGAQATRRMSAIKNESCAVLEREHSTDLVFANHNDRASFPRRAWNNALEQAQIEDFRFHDLRHTAASYLAMTPGTSLADIAEVLGHKTLAMVKRYSHLSDDHIRTVVERMNRQFLY